MASGTGERPLPDIADEKSLLGLFSSFNAIRFDMAANTTIYILLPIPSANAYRQGLVLIGGSAATKSGIYFYNGTNATNLHVDTVLAASYSGVSVTKGGNNYLKVTNGTTVLTGTIISGWGERPIITSTQPT